MNKEKTGTLLVLLTVFSEATLPVLSKYLVSFIDPIFLGAVVGILAFLPIGIYLFWKGELKILIRKDVLLDFVKIGFFGSFLYSALMFSGAKLTSGINTALMQQTEVIFALILGYFILKEKIRFKQICATAIILTGVLLLVYNRPFTLNIGDILLAITPLGLQLSYISAKNAIKKVGIFPTIGARFIYGTIMLFILSTFLKTTQFSIFFDVTKIFPITLLSLFTITSLISWYLALSRINLSKATSLIASWPAVSILLAWLVLNEIPTTYQLFGLIAIIGGMELISIGNYLMVDIPSEKRK